MHQVISYLVSKSYQSNDNDLFEDMNTDRYSAFEDFYYRYLSGNLRFQPAVSNNNSEDEDSDNNENSGYSYGSN